MHIASVAGPDAARGRSGADSLPRSTTKLLSPKSGEAGGRRGTTRLACRLSREIASAFFDIPLAEIERPNRAVVPVCDARHVAIYLAHVVFQISLNAMAGEFGRDRTTVAHAVRRIEDRRDDAAFDALLGRLERLAHAVHAAMQREAAEAKDGGGQAVRRDV
ncbi:helix-turn-helix domain-containing protein [Aurantimonas sp. VKM B-3413]|uniref:helix-turn-helix domain-containing protein n=1 Tax=Aurantimonas sp. VKM B-3413 TaxID=2779401 RepID=UPI001E5C7CC2|nr:helix-turn-helix domain-containing protein [Aurantimonas sp. VKM B-3413]MCB8838855.1 hypothetical protein [Aurantimonas sp. VKM B-3413]